MPIRTLLLTMALATGCSPPVPPPPAAPVSAWTGCYLVLPAAPFPSSIGEEYRLPDSIALEAATAKIRYDKRREYRLRAAYPSFVSRRQRLGFLTWTPIEDDSVEALVWADGFVGITLRLGRHDGTIRGRAKWENDVIVIGADEEELHPSVPVEVKSIPCPSTASQWSR
jgi:hypothetical protein